MTYINWTGGGDSTAAEVSVTNSGRVQVDAEFPLGHLTVGMAPSTARGLAQELITAADRADWPGVSA